MKAVLFLVATLVVLATAPAALAQLPPSGGVDKEGSWYVGENLRVGDYFSYDLCHMGSNPTNDSKNSAMWHTNRKVLIIPLVILLMI